MNGAKEVYIVFTSATRKHTATETQAVQVILRPFVTQAQSTEAACAPIQQALLREYPTADGWQDHTAEATLLNFMLAGLGLTLAPAPAPPTKAGLH